MSDDQTDYRAQRGRYPDEDAMTAIGDALRSLTEAHGLLLMSDCKHSAEHVARAIELLARSIAGGR